MLLAETLMIVLGVLGALLLVLIAVAMWAIKIYNLLVTLRERYKNAFGNIDTQLQRRYDLIPNLVEVAKGVMSHERETLEAVIAMRNQAVGAAKAAAANPGDPTAMANLASAEGGLAGAMGKLMLVVEAYPDLKANENMMQVQEELTSTENKVAYSRQAYNDSVTVFNTQRAMFPNMFIASAFNFGPATLFEITDPAVREAPKVDFSS